MLMGNCSNLNHSKMNVTVKYCPGCGEVVSKTVQSKSCNESVHSKRRKERNKYCVDCGDKLMD